MDGISRGDCRVAPQLWAAGPILATTVHGLLEDPTVLQGVTGHRPIPVLEHNFDLADAVEAHLDGDYLMSLVES